MVKNHQMPYNGVTTNDWRPPKIGGPVRPNTSNIPNAGPVFYRFQIVVSEFCRIVGEIKVPLIPDFRGQTKSMRLLYVKKTWGP